MGGWIVETGMMSETRKLAAILAADVVGFSRLAGADEDRTLARLRALRSDLIDPTIAVHNGRVVKRMGDGFLVEFRSVVDAVRCAIEVQNSMVERNAGLPEERRIEFRIGIHLGDVVEESDGDLMGDGVNIAARLEGIAKPGAICLSEDAYRQVRARLDFAVSDLGEAQLKNIAEPVRIYSLEVGVPAQAKPAPPAKPAAPEKPSPPPASRKPSIAVLAFNNMSGDAEQEYFSDGISEDIITDLSKLSELHVVARNSSFVYKKAASPVAEVAKALGVRYVLEGSVRKAGNRVRVTAQLIDSTQRRPCLGEPLRSRSHRYFRHSGRTHQGDRLCAQIETDDRRAGPSDPAARDQRPGLRTVPARPRAGVGGDTAQPISRRAACSSAPSPSIRNMRRPTPSSP